MTRGTVAVVLAFGASVAGSQGTNRQIVEWPTYGGDAGGMKYSPLTDVNRDNVRRLARAWSWDTKDPASPPADSGRPARPGNFQATPLMINDTLYLPTALNQVVALDANTGRELWRFDPQAYRAGQPSNGTGLVHRGVASWSDGRQRRIFINSRWRLFALDATTGRPIPSFGANGEIDLTVGLSRSVNRLHYTNTSPPVVWGDLVILGNGVGDRLMYRGDPSGDVQAIDVRSGKRVWRFNPVPGPGEVGHETWGNDSWKHTGHTNVWAPFTVDSARGLVYLPFGTPSNDWYGGRRPGMNLFGETLVCLDARTGRRVWHFQTVHHGLWDYDLPAPPNVITVRQGGRAIDAVVQVTKMGLLFAFERVTGRPLWPIDERPVPASDVPGEQAWPTQPIPRLPAPFARTGISEADAADFTPAIHQAALAALRRYRLGPLFTPPSLEGTVTLPGSIGGAGWGGAMFDPASNTLFVKATNSPSVWRILARPTPSDTNDMEYAADLANSSITVRLGDAAPIPVIKPPYGTLTAIDMATGAQRWQVPLGDTPGVRSHPALRGVAIPPYLGVAGAPGGVVTAGGLVFITGGGSVLYAIDVRNGTVAWQGQLEQDGYANPMTYRTRAGRQFVVVATGAGATARLVAFAIAQVPDARE
ncbi:MAG: pyrroloquinoline quinone-dependent dehydrogenase [Gemmatimonadaceae bacterium]|nr:pyrroloquinoline quinone-dependent dehydrogenase [Gemmatimonadaceae bacterium]